jgi:hypothetical protein
MMENNSFSGFMPMVSNITIGQIATMINTEGELVEAHSITVKVVDGAEYVFSMTTENLMKLYFLIPKAL